MWGKFEICTMKYIQIAQQSSLKMHNEIVKNCTTKLSKNAQQNCQKLHNEIVKKCTTKLSKIAQRNCQKLHNKNCIFFITEQIQADVAPT